LVAKLIIIQFVFEAQSYLRKAGQRDLIQPTIAFIPSNK